MTIPIVKEDVEELKKWGLGLEKLIERCHFCGQPTRLWHDASNTPVCGGCASSKSVTDIRAAIKKATE